MSMTNSIGLFDYILLGMGVYVLVSGIRGKGRLFTAENIKEGMEQKFIQTMRVLYIILGVIMVVNGCVSVVKYQFYAYQEAATSTAAAPVYEWAATKDLGAFSFLTVPVLNIITYVCMGLCLACIVYMIVVIRKLTDKNAPAKRAAQGDGQAAAQAAKQAGHTLPVSAFDFSDDEPEAAGSAPENENGEQR